MVTDLTEPRKLNPKLGIRKGMFYRTFKKALVLCFCEERMANVRRNETLTEKHLDPHVPILTHLSDRLPPIHSRKYRFMLQLV